MALTVSARLFTASVPLLLAATTGPWAVVAVAVNTIAAPAGVRLAPVPVVVTVSVVVSESSAPLKTTVLGLNEPDAPTASPEVVIATSNPPPPPPWRATLTV